MNAVFVDTGYLFALEITNDQHHQAATQHWQGTVAALPRLVITSYVFDEVVTFFNSRGQHAKAIEVGNNLGSLGLAVGVTTFSVYPKRVALSILGPSMA